MLLTPRHRAQLVTAAVVLAAAAASSAFAYTRTASLGTIPSDCSEAHPCRLHAGTYRLGSSAVLPSLELAVPGGWSSTEDSLGELKLVAPDHPDEILDIWLDMRAVKSSGRGHGNTVLGNVGKSPSALVAWLTSDRDFQIVSRPRTSSIGNGIRATTIAVGVSGTANYGDAGCPANPRCADLFRNPLTWLPGDSFGIGGAEQARLYLAKIKSNGWIPHTLEICLDAPDHSKLVSLTAIAKRVIATIRLPAGITPG